MVLSTVFHSINSPDNSPSSHSVLPVLSLPFWSKWRQKGKGPRRLNKNPNTFGSLEDDTGMEVEASQTSLPSSLSGSTSFLK